MHISSNGAYSVGRCRTYDFRSDIQWFASILRDEIRHLNEAAADFLTVNMGATAIGTGICAEPGYAENVWKHCVKLQVLISNCRQIW